MKYNTVIAEVSLILLFCAFFAFMLPMIVSSILTLSLTMKFFYTGHSLDEFSYNIAQAKLSTDLDCAKNSTQRAVELNVSIAGNYNYVSNQICIVDTGNEDENNRIYRHELTHKKQREKNMMGNCFNHPHVFINELEAYLHEYFEVHYEGRVY